MKVMHDSKLSWVHCIFTITYPCIVKEYADFRAAEKETMNF